MAQNEIVKDRPVKTWISAPYYRGGRPKKQENEGLTNEQVRKKSADALKERKSRFCF